MKTQACILTGESHGYPHRCGVCICNPVDHTRAYIAAGMNRAWFCLIGDHGNVGEDPAVCCKLLLLKFFLNRLVGSTDLYTHQ